MVEKRGEMVGSFCYHVLKRGIRATLIGVLFIIEEDLRRKMFVWLIIFSGGGGEIIASTRSRKLI